MSNRLQTFLLSTALLAVAFMATISWSSWYNTKLDVIQRCVVDSARSQGFAGDVYSKEAWVIFSPLCK